MSSPNYRNEDSWRGQMLVSQMAIRQSIGELGFLITGLFLAYLLSAFLPGLGIVAAATMCAGAIFSVWRISKAQNELTAYLTADPEANR